MRDNIWPGWQTIRLIGRGSFGAVYEIERDMFGEKEKAALKVISIPQNEADITELRSDGYDEESITSTFQSHLKSIVAEYSLMRKMNGSANVVNCDDVRYIQHDDGIGWDIFIKMELLTPLIDTLPAQIPEETAVQIGIDICKALVLCRKYDIVHRDIKPQNIFVSPNGDYKLGDFGIAKTVEKTSGGTKIGTYKYMAPEVYNNQPYGAAADIYSLGLVLYWLLNERRMPFLPLPPAKLSAGMDEDARLRRLGGEPIPAPKHGSEAMKRIVLKACAYDPDNRYHTADEMFSDLSALQSSPATPFIAPDSNNDSPELANESGEDLTMGVFSDSSVSEADEPVGMPSANPPVKKKQPWSMIAATVLLACIGVGVFGYFHCWFGHKLTEATCTQAKTCTVCGITIGSPDFSTHAYQNGMCLICGESQLKLNDIISFGHYTLDNNFTTGMRAIAWQVLDIQGNKALLISRYGLDAKPYNTEPGNSTWEKCSLRSWLNKEFLNTAFTADEQKAILTTTVDNSKNQGYSEYDTSGGSDTQDKIFLLSCAEAIRYFDLPYYTDPNAGTNVKARISPTAFAKDQGAFTTEEYQTVEGRDAGWWWLRSPGHSQERSSCVLSNGSLRSNRVEHYNGCVRPALWINLDSDAFIAACQAGING